MILLEIPSAYQNAYDFLLFEQDSEINLSNPLAEISVYRMDSIFEKILPRLLVCVKKKVSFDLNEREIEKMLERELLFQRDEVEIQFTYIIEGIESEL